MEIVQRDDGKVLVATTHATRVDARVASDFKQQLLALVAARPRVVLDLSEVDFIDSSGLGAMVAVLKQLDGRGDLVIAGLRPAVMNLFKLTRMDRVFRLYGAASDAVAALS